MGEGPAVGLLASGMACRHAGPLHRCNAALSPIHVLVAYLVRRKYSVPLLSGTVK